MPSPISVKIEVPAWMKKYLIFQAENKTEPIYFSRKSKFNFLLINLISNYKNITGIVSTKQNEPLYNNTSIKIKLPFNNIKDVYFYNNISYDKKIIFRNEVRNDFYFQYHNYIRFEMMKGLERKVATENFLKMININEDELKYESLYRKFSRYINRRKLIV